MYSNYKLGGIIGGMLIFFTTAILGQVEMNTSIGELMFQEYQEQGIDEAILKYQDLKEQDSEGYEWNEWVLNNLGYRLMGQGDFEAAEKVFLLNIEEYPRAANPNDSYADLLIKTGNKEKAKAYLRKSISIAEKSTNQDEKTRILYGSTAKLAKLENKHRQLDFLVGNWESNETFFQDGKAVGTRHSYNETSYDKENSVLIVNYKDGQGITFSRRIIAYDANNDEFDIAYINLEGLNGIETSSMKLKKGANNTYEFIEHYMDRNNKKRQSKHTLGFTTENNMEWVIFDRGDEAENWEKVAAINLKKMM